MVIIFYGVVMGVMMFVLFFFFVGVLFMVGYSVYSIILSVKEV